MANQILIKLVDAIFLMNFPSLENMYVWGGSPRKLSRFSWKDSLAGVESSVIREAGFLTADLTRSDSVVGYCVDFCFFPNTIGFN